MGEVPPEDSSSPKPARGRLSGAFRLELSRQVAVRVRELLGPEVSSPVLALRLGDRSPARAARILAGTQSITPALVGTLARRIGVTPTEFLGPLLERETSEGVKLAVQSFLYTLEGTPARGPGPAASKRLAPVGSPATEEHTASSDMQSEAAPGVGPSAVPPAWLRPRLRAQRRGLLRRFLTSTVRFGLRITGKARSSNPSL